jgi:GT2 family glycosyltransferase
MAPANAPAILSIPAPARLRVRRPSRPALADPFLSAIIVNYRSWSGTYELARRLAGSPSGQKGTLEVMVVDNHSPAHRLATRLRRAHGISFRRWGQNRGFARAVNEGNRLSRGRWVLILNPDVSVTQELVEGVMSLAARLEIEEPRAGIVGFQLHNSDGSRQLSTGAFPTLGRALAGLLRPRARRKYREPKGRERCRVPWVTGCCLLVRRDCLRDLGGFDNDFFLYYEDVDLCRRAWQRGWSVWYEPSLAAVHHAPLHARTVSSHMRLVIRHALLTYAAKHWSRWQLRLLGGIIGAEAVARKLWAHVKGDSEAADCFNALRSLARALGRGRTDEGRRLLRRAVRLQERRLAP